MSSRLGRLLGASVGRKTMAGGIDPTGPAPGRGRRVRARPRSRIVGTAAARPGPEDLEARLLLASIPIGFSSWTAVGPAPVGASSGRIVAVAGDPTDARTLYVAAAGGGVWKSTDAGASWTSLTDDQPGLAMGALAVAPSDPKVIYAGTGEANNSGDSNYGEGILKSTDGGASWTLEDNGGAFSRKTTAKIVVSPTDPNTAFAAIDDLGVNCSGGNIGIWKTTDGGKTWANTTTGISTTVQFSDVAIDPTNPLDVYAAAGTFYGDAANGVYKSTDGGTTWAAAGNFPGGSSDGRIALAIAPSSPQTLYAAISTPAGQLLSMQKTTDGGTTWSTLSNCPNFLVGGQGWYDIAVAVDPKNANVVYGAGVLDYANNNKMIVTTQDGGTTWSDLTKDSVGTEPHTDVHALGFDASGKLLFGSDGGIWRLDNATTGSTKWADLNTTGLQITQFTGIALDPNNAGVLYGGSQDNGTEKYSGGVAWPEIYGGDGGFVGVDPNKSNVVYTENYDISLARSNDGGSTWTDATNGINLGDKSDFYVPFAVDPTTSGRLVLGTDHIYESTDYGDDWTAIGTPGTAGFNAGDATIDSIAISKTSPGTIYATGGGHVYVTSDDGKTWATVGPAGATDTFSDVAIDPTNSKVAYVTRNAFNGTSNSGHVFETTDGGTTWKDISGSGTGLLPNLPVDSVAVGSLGGLNFLWVGTDRGVYASTDGGASWSAYQSGLPNVQVVSLDFSASLDLLAAGTHGRGAWEIKPGGAIVLTAVPPTGLVQGTAFSGVVATFTDNNSSLTTGDFTATIGWGDGTTTAGTIAVNPAGGYEVLGSHTYASGGSYTFSVTVASDQGASVSATASISVAGPPLIGSASALSLNEGDSYTGAIASFIDSNPNPTTPIDYSATINWGDGTTSSGQVVAEPSGPTPAVAGSAYEVVGSHIYGAGNYVVTVTIVSDNNSSVVLSAGAAVADLPLAAQAVPASLLEGSAFKGIVATFTDADPRNPPLTNYSATIAWGDGTTSAGTITSNPFAAGYAVVGTNFFSAGTYVATVTIRDLGGSTAVVSPTITVKDAPLTGSGGKFTTQEGNTARIEVATFTDADPIPHAGSFYTVAINWGDGTSSAGQVIPDGQGGYLVFGTHAYLAGTYAFSTTITDTGGQATTKIKGTATITPSPITAVGSPVTASAGTPFLGTVATFTTAASNLSASSFTASIKWGDGNVSAGAIRANPKGGFLVVGSNTFANTGTFPVSVTISSKSGATTSITTTATVKPGTITVVGVPISGDERSTLGGVVAAFRATDPSLASGSFTATIDWGDGQTTLGSIGVVAGGFSVSGLHAYALSGSYPITVTVASTTGAGASGSTTASVAFVPYPVLGGLTASSTPNSSAGNVTNQTHPVFGGKALPGSTVTIYAQIVGTVGVTPIGVAAVGADGTWAAQSTLTLPTGAYNISAVATDPAGVAGPAVSLLPTPTSGPLIVDTGAVHVTGLALNPARSQFRVGLAAGISGLNQADALNPTNYSVEYVSASGATTPVAVTGVSLASGTPTGGEQVVVSFGKGGKLRAGSYVLTVRSAGVEDNAGNALVENYYVPYPAAYTAPGNDYQAAVATNGKTTGSPQQFVPPSAAAGAKAHTSFIRSHLKVQKAARRR